MARVQEQAFASNLKNQVKLLEEGTDPNQYFPLYNTGARAFITINNKPVAVCLSLSYSIQVDTDEVRTIDTHLPWDIHINQITVRGTLRRLVNPEGSQESDSLFHTIQSAIHAPIVEMLVQDASGTTLFFTKGMFHSIEGQIQLGQMTINNIGFKGTMYQNHVYQKFKPYPDDGIGKFSRGLNKALGNLGKFPGF